MRKKLKAVVDTNIFISVLLGGTSTSKLVDAFIEGRFNLAISELLLKELRRTLQKPRLSSLD
ncbi:MAG: putative toxin-antitoxin system toxin component, PIN family [Candidatus Omnitrophota bacterium]